MKLIDKILYYISVPKCVACGERLSAEDTCLCADCLSDYREHCNRNCSSCAKVLSACGCTNEYLDAHLVHRLAKVFRYTPDHTNTASRLIYSLKRDNDRRVLEFLSDELALAIKNSIPSPEDYIFTSVPRRRSAKVKYGIDHAALLSAKTAEKLGAEHRVLLVSKSKHAQKSAGGIENRIKNIDIRLKREGCDLSGKRVIIIDDIVTTGASMACAAIALKGAGAKSITGAALAIAYKDNRVI